MPSFGAQFANRGGRRAFSLAELLVVCGIIAILMSLILPGLQMAQGQAMSLKCMASQRQLVQALDQAFSEYDFYPYWDDGGAPIRYTWIDVLAQVGYLANTDIGYCPLDGRPDPLNEQRARAQDIPLIYPNNRTRCGVDYSYGICVPLSAGGWEFRLDPSSSDKRPRRFVNHLKDVSRRALIVDGTWPAIFNLSCPEKGNIWNSGTEWDNTVAYRHQNNGANVAYQDGHVEPVRYTISGEKRLVDTNQTFVWHTEESKNLCPDDSYLAPGTSGANWYPNVPPPSNIPSGPSNGPGSGVMPREMFPYYYTNGRLWDIPNK